MRFNISLNEEIERIIDNDANSLGLNRSAYLSYLAAKERGVSRYAYARDKFSAAIKCLMGTEEYWMRFGRARLLLSGVRLDDEGLPVNTLQHFNLLENIVGSMWVEFAEKSETDGPWFRAAKSMSEELQRECSDLFLKCYRTLVVAAGNAI